MLWQWHFLSVLLILILLYYSKFRSYRSIPTNNTMNKLSSIPKFQKLSSCVSRVLGCNPGPMTLQGTNTYLVGTGPRKLLIDSGEANNSEYLSLLESTLKTNDYYISDIIITHWHHDHVGGVADICKMMADQAVDEPKVSKFPRSTAPELSLGNIPYHFIKDRHIFKTDGATLRAYHTPGHSEDHLILFLEEENAIFSGDNILGEGTTIMEDLFNYMRSLQFMLDLNPQIIYPGHGPIVNSPIDTIQGYIQHRELRESQILNFLKENHPKALSVQEVRAKVYENLDSKLYKAAEQNIVLHLKKLEKERRVQSFDGTGSSSKWSFVTGSIL